MSTAPRTGGVAAFLWDRLESGWWAEISAGLSQPWPREAALFDMRWMASRHHRGQLVAMPGRPTLAERWGWGDRATRNFLLRPDRWRDPEKIYHWDRMPRIWWENIAAGLRGAWPRAAALFDLRFQQSRKLRGVRHLLHRRRLRARWNWTEKPTRSVMAQINTWMDPSWLAKQAKKATVKVGSRFMRKKKGSKGSGGPEEVQKRSSKPAGEALSLRTGTRYRGDAFNVPASPVQKRSRFPLNKPASSYTGGPAEVQNSGSGKNPGSRFPLENGRFTSSGVQPGDPKVQLRSSQGPGFGQKNQLPPTSGVQPGSQMGPHARVRTDGRLLLDGPEKIKERKKITHTDCTHEAVERSTVVQKRHRPPTKKRPWTDFNSFLSSMRKQAGLPESSPSAPTSRATIPRPQRSETPTHSTAENKPYYSMFEREQRDPILKLWNDLQRIHFAGIRLRKGSPDELAPLSDGFRRILTAALEKHGETAILHVWHWWQFAKASRPTWLRKKFGDDGAATLMNNLDRYVVEATKDPVIYWGAERPLWIRRVMGSKEDFECSTVERWAERKHQELIEVRQHIRAAHGGWPEMRQWVEGQVEPFGVDAVMEYLRQQSQQAGEES